MKKIISILFVILYSFNMLFASIVFALENKVQKVSNTKKTVQKKIDNKKTLAQLSIEHWKKKKRKIIESIYQQTNISELMDLTKASEQLQSISEKLDNVITMYRTFKIQKKNIDKKYKTIYKQAKLVLKILKKRKEKLQKILFKIKMLSKDLENLKKQLKDIKNEIYISKIQIKKYVIVLYKINNDYYSSVNGIDNIKLLFKNNKNIAKALSQEDIIKLLSLQTKVLIKKLKDKEKRKKQFLRKIYLKRAEYVNLVNEYKLHIKLLNDRKKILLDMYKMLKNNKKQIDKYYVKYFKKAFDLKKQQKKILDSIKWKNNNIWTWNKILSWDLKDQIKAKPIDLSDVITHTIKVDSDKFLNWPTKDAIAINAYFHDERYFKKFGWQHDGMDIRVHQASPIYAAAAWYVYKVVDNNSDYYNYIILVHNYGYITLYWHISKALVKEGQIVERWQIIALSWWKKWTRWAWKLSTWPHLHFEVYKNWQLIDPMSAMDLSVYPDKKYVPDKWKIKYIKDTLTRKIDLSNVKIYSFKIPHKKREEMFLQKAYWPFKNLELWLNAGKKYGIDPDVGICIAYAESWLWNNLSSKNNLWNVGNNDRWDRVDMPSPQVAVNSIFATLNNKYLRKYHTIYRLSRYWNKESHIYSSSNYNWYKNVVKCLSKIKAYPIDEYYPFRTVPESVMKKIEENYKNLK